VGCDDEKNDVIAAYTHALLYVYTRHIQYATKAKEIMDAWSAVQRSHTNANAPLIAAWTGEMFPRTAEIIRYMTPKGFWPAASIKRFSKMLVSYYVPLIKNGRANGSGGNWELSMAEAMINIGVFVDSKNIFNRGIALWKRRVPAYFYLKSDGKLPVPPRPNIKGQKLVKYWGQKKFVNGLSQETCRDLLHTNLGVSASINAAETANIQGVDLYGKEQKRLTAAMEFHAAFLNGKAVPSWLCGGKLVYPEQVDSRYNTDTYDIAYNHYHYRKGLKLPQTGKLLNKIRPTDATVVVAWETLTHANSGKSVKR